MMPGGSGCGVTRPQGRGMSPGPRPQPPWAARPLSCALRKGPSGTAFPTSGEARHGAPLPPPRVASRQGRVNQAQGNRSARTVPQRRAGVGGPGCSGLLGLLALQAATSGPFPPPCHRREGQPRGRPRTSCRISPPSLGVCWMLLGEQSGACTPARTSEGAPLFAEIMF